MADLKIEEKLKKLKDYWYNDDYSLKWVKNVEKKIRDLVVKEALSENKAVIPIVSDAKSRISAINKLLVYDVEMLTEVRKMLIRERDVHQFWLNRFDGSNMEQQLERVGKLLDEELEHLN